MPRREILSSEDPETLLKQPPATGEGRNLHPLAYGIERIGLISLRFPYLVAAVLAVAAILAAFGIGRIKVDDSLSQLFRSNTPEFHQYEDVTARFPSSEYDVLLVIQGDKLLARDNLSKLRDLVTDLQLIDGTRGDHFLFSARQPPEGDHLPAPLFPEPLPEGAAYDALLQKVMSNEILRGKLLSLDGKLTLAVLALDPAVVNSGKLRDVVGEVRKTMDEDLAGSGLSAELSGVPGDAARNPQRTSNATGLSIMHLAFSAGA